MKHFLRLGLPLFPFPSHHHAHIHTKQIPNPSSCLTSKKKAQLPDALLHPRTAYVKEKKGKKAMIVVLKRRSRLKTSPFFFILFSSGFITTLLPSLYPGHQ
jgi:hypothetical protein